MLLAAKLGPGPWLIGYSHFPLHPSSRGLARCGQSSKFRVAVVTRVKTSFSRTSDFMVRSRISEFILYL